MQSEWTVNTKVCYRLPSTSIVLTVLFWAGSTSALVWSDKRFGHPDVGVCDENSSMGAPVCRSILFH